MRRMKSSVRLFLCVLLILALATPAFAAEYDLVLNHDDSPDPVVAGGEVAYTIRVTNNGYDYPVTNIQLTDTLPSGIVFVSATPLQGSCGAPSGSDPNRQLTCNLGTLDPQSGGTYETTVVVRVRTTVSGTITNKASVTSPDFVDPDLSNNSQDELTTVNAGANLRIAKVASPTPSVQSGATLTYNLTVTNAGPDIATNVRVTDNLPTGFVRTGSLPSGCGQAGQVVTCNLSGSIAVGGNRVIGPINGTVTAASLSTLTNSASVTITDATAPQDPDMSNNTVTVDTAVTAGCDLGITKTQSVPNPVIVGDSFSYFLTVTSIGDNLSNITVTDNIPVNFTLGTPSGSGWDCSGTVGQNVICTRAGIGSGSRTFPVITIPVTAITTGTVINTGTVTSTTPGFIDPFPGDNSSSITTDILTPNADLRANKTALRLDGTPLTPPLVRQGVPFLYRINVTNLGPSAIKSGTLTMTDTLPAGLTANSYAATNGWTCTALPLPGPATITCTIPGNLAVGATSPNVDINVTATATGSLTNHVCMSGGVPADNNSGNDCDDVTVISQEYPTDLQVFKTDSPDPVNAGEILTYAIEIVNISTVTATTVTLTDTFTTLINNSVGATGAGFIDAVVANGIATGGSCISAASGGTGRLMTCTFTSIPQCTKGVNCPVVTARVRPRGEGERTNTAYAVSSDVVDANITDNTGSTTTTVIAIADVRTTITDTPDPLAVGTNLTYVGTIINDGPSNAADGTITITLPLGVAFISTSPSAGSCGTTPGVSGTITTAGNQTVSCNLGNITLLGGQRTVTIVVRPTLAVSASFSTTITASSVVWTGTTESDGTNNSGSTTTVVTNPGHDLLVNQTDSPDPVAVGDNVTYTITATNNGPSYATAVRVVDNLPSTRLSFVSATPSTGSCSALVGNVLTCDLGDIPVSQSRTIAVVMTGILKGVDNNTVTVSSEETRAGYPDNIPGNNSVSEDTTVRSKVDIEIISKVPSLGTVEMRQPFNWTISIRNNTGAGLAEADDVVLSDTLPAGMELTGTPSVSVTSGTFSSTTCTGIAGQTSFSCSLGTVSNGATGTITVPVRARLYPVSIPHTTSNCTSLTTSSIDTNTANNTNICGIVTVQKSSIAGTVYRDLNNNGAQSGVGETGIAAVQLRLQGTDFYNNTVNITTTTDASGNYIFDSLSSSNVTGYTITETQPANYFDGKDTPGTGCGTANCGTAGGALTDIISGIQLAANSTAITYLFGELPGNMINGYVYSDADNDGNHDGGEAGIPSVTLTLSGTDYGPDGVAGGGDDVAVSRTTTTDSNGLYEFTGLRAGNYRVDETQPAAYLDGKDTAGTVDGVACATCSTVTNDRISKILMPTFGITAADMNFGELLPGSLSGSVYNDINNNGIREGTEAGIPGITVTLTGTNDLGTITPVVAITDVSGNFSFVRLRPGTYVITETQPLDFVDGLDTAGSLGGSTAVKNVISAIPLAAGQNGIVYIFGERGTGVTGSVYLDSNNNGVREGTEAGIPNVTVTLTGSGSAGTPVSRTTTTAADGSYAFYGLPASGTTGYTITETQPPAWGDGLDTAGSAGGTAGNDVISGIRLLGTTVASGYIFGERGGSLAGFVYNDANSNGVKNPGEQGIQGVTVALTGTGYNSNAISQTTTTGSDGSYSFIDLPRPNGSGYTITETQPVGYIDGAETIGSLGGSTPANDVLLIPQASFPGGANGTGYNFGELVNQYAQVSGRVWFDANHNRADDEGSSAGRQGWHVELIKRDNPLDNSGYVLIAQATTATDGSYAFTNVLPNSAGLPTDRYEIRFRHPQNNSVFGVPISNGTGFDLTYGTIRKILLNAGDNVINQSLPLDPGGVIYSSVTRRPIAGATITISGPGGFDPASHLVGGAANATQVTGTDGIYQYWLIPTAPAGEYRLTVISPAGYLPFPSEMIPSCTTMLTVNATDPPLHPPVLIQNSNTAPATGMPLQAPTSCPAASGPGGVGTGSDSTRYYLLFYLTPGTSASVVNNHIPIDPVLGGAIIVTKTTPMVNVKRGDLVPYTITMTNTLSATLTNIDARDTIPPGFKYRKGSATLNGVHREPKVAGRQLIWHNLTFTAGEKKTFMMILVVGAGVSEGEYTNQAYALNDIVHTAVSNIATATVRVIPDPTFDCADIIGKVFDDKNANGYQDEGEPGIANVRLATARGLLVTTDAEGRFHIPCPAIPNENRGSNFILKLDDRTLPSGYRITTENPRVVRLTRGKMTKMNFGAAVHRVIRIDVNDAAFEKEGAQLLAQWQQKIQALETQLREKPSVIRIAYRKGAEPASLVDKRIRALRDMLQTIWKKGKDCPPLVFEEEIVEVR